MYTNRHIKRIKGRVFVDSNNNGIWDEGEISLKDISLSLYYVSSTNTKQLENSDDEVTMFREKLIFKTTTNRKGEYVFYVNEGKYLIKLDIESIPKGKGVVNSSIFIDGSNTKDNDFLVRDIASIELENGLSKEFISHDEVVLNPVFKDNEGNVLSAKFSYSFDSDEVNIKNDKFSLRSEILEDKKIKLNISTGLISKQAELEFKIPEINSIEKIRLAYESGMIDEPTKISNYLSALHNRGNLRAEFDSQIPIKSGTTAVKEIQDYITKRNADRKLVEESRAYISSSIPDLEKVYTSSSGYFKIHYTIKGKHAVSHHDSNGSGIPDYIETIAASFDQVKNYTNKIKGYRTPLLDKDKKTFDVYVTDLEGVYGVTFSSEYYNDRNARTRKASAYIKVDNNYAPSKGFKDERDNCLKVTVAHEFFHATQYAYNVDADSWWKEASATWIEDEIYNGIDDYIRYVKGLFDSPQKSLEKSSYGGVVFAKFIAENYGGNETIKRIWELHDKSSESSVNIIDKAAKERDKNESIGTVFSRYAAYNFNPVQYYKEGGLWKDQVRIDNTYSKYPIGLQTGRLNHLSTNYQLFKTNLNQKGNVLKITFDGSDQMNWGFKIQKRRVSDNKCEITEVKIDGKYNRVEVTLNNFGDVYKEVCLISCNLEKKKDGLSYSYTASN